MADFRNFNINGVDASIALATDTDAGLMSSDNYNVLEEMSDMILKAANSETIIYDSSVSFNISDSLSNKAFSVDSEGVSARKYIIKDSSGNILNTIGRHIISETDDALYITDYLGNVAFQVDSGGVSYYGKISKSDLSSITIDKTVETNNYYPADINMCISFGQSNSLAGNNPSPQYDFENALVFKGSTGTGQMSFAGGVIDDKTDDELEAVFGGGFASLQDYTGSLYTMGGGIYEYMKTLKEENNIENYDSLGFQFLGVTCGQVVNIKTLTNPDDVYYKRILTCVTYAKKYANALGKSFSVPYFNYIEGEADLNSDETYFYDMLWTFFSNIDKDIKDITGQENDIMFLTYQPGRYVGPLDASSHKNGAADALVKLSIDNGDSTGYTLDSTAQSYLKDGYSLIDRSYIHFSCPFYFLASQLGYQEGVTATPTHLSWDKGIFNIFGAYQGLQAKRSLTDGHPISTLYPKSHSIMSNSDGSYTVNVEFNVPVPPLQFKKYDETLGNYASQTLGDDGYEINYGFHLTDTKYSNTLVDIITSVSIKRMKFVEIKTSSNPTGMYLIYANKGWLSGGNLCDSQGNYNQVELGSNTFPLDNWCPVFDYLLN